MATEGKRVMMERVVAVVAAVVTIVAEDGCVNNGCVGWL